MDPMLITILFLVFAMVMFFTEKIPVAFTAMIVLVGYIVTGVLEPKEAFAGFTNSTVLLFMAMFIVGDALFITGAANKIGGVVTKFAKSEKHAIIIIMLTSGLLSGLLSNTGTAAIIIPVILGIAKSANYSRSRLLMTLVAAAAMGGNLTLLGAPGNMIASSQLELAGLEGFSIFEFTKIGLPILIAGIIYYALIGYKLLPAAGERGVADDSFIYDKELSFDNVPRWKQIASIVVMILTVLAMVFESKIGIPFYVTAWIGAIVMVVMGVMTEKQAMSSLDMSTILLFVGTLSIGTALEKTGAGTVIANIIVGIVGDNPIVILAAILITCIVMTNFMSNTATTALMAPIGLSIAMEIGADPRAVLMAVVIGGSCAYATPIGMPANTMVYGIGGFKFSDYTKVGLPLIFINFLVSLILLPILFPFFP